LRRLYRELHRACRIERIIGMRYMGGKTRLSRYIAPLINKDIEDLGVECYYEPFVGAGSVLERVVCKYRFASDINCDIIEMFKAVQSGWTPPESVSREYYDFCRANRDTIDPALRAFVAFGCSFGGREWNGHARYKDGRDATSEAYRSILKQAPKIRNVYFRCADYRELNPVNSVIYCDPPYDGTCKYEMNDNSIEFNSEEFWDTVSLWSETNVVYVSEYNAPIEITPYKEFGHHKTINNVNGGSQVKTVERLYRISKLGVLNECIESV
jgi:DNA adenine methylase